MAKQKFSVRKLALYGNGVSVRSELSLMIHNGRTYIEISDNESGQNQRRAKISLSADSMDLVGRTLIGLANGDILGQHTRGFSSVTQTLVEES